MASLSRRRNSQTPANMSQTGLEQSLRLEATALDWTSKPLSVQESLCLVRSIHHDTGSIHTDTPNTNSQATPQEMLQRCFSVPAILTTTFAFAERMQELRTADPTTVKLRPIGRGTFGTVFEIPGTNIAVKKHGSRAAY